MTARLVVFAGLPGSGKTTVSRAVADRLGACFVRIDSIESAVAATLAPVGGSPVGYVVAAQVAHDQLVPGRDVVVDAVNAVEIAREGWRRLAADHRRAPEVRRGGVRRRRRAPPPGRGTDG